MDKPLSSIRFKKVLLDLKQRRQLTYEKLAAVFDKEKSFISQMANGYTSPNVDVVKHLEKEYEVNPIYIYDGEGDMYTKSTFDVNQFLVSKVVKNEAMLDVILELLSEIAEPDENKRQKLFKKLVERIESKISLVPGRNDTDE